MTVFMLLIFFVLLVLAMPIGYALIMSSGFAIILTNEIPLIVAVTKIFQPTQSFPLLAIPFFILSGNIMMGGKLGERLINFATALVGRRNGGLGQVTVVGCTVFGGVSGSAVAEASALGSMMIPWQKREGYPPAFSAAAVAASSVIAGLIPPSIALILYAVVANQSIAALFMAGVLPGLLLCFGFLIVCSLSGRLRQFPKLTEKMTWSYLLLVFLKSLPALMMPVFIVVLLRAGIATPTEVSIIAVTYGAVVSALIYRDMTLARLYKALVHTAITTGVVMLVITSSNLVGYILTVESVPTLVANWALETLKNPLLIILMLNLIMLLLGMFLDLPAAILLLGPTFVSIAQAIGLDLVQLGVMMAVNLSIGLFTPPVGTTLFIATAISKEPMGRVAKELLPFYLVSLLVLIMMSYLPSMTIY
ncbi:TRAP transporter large permease [Conservatibacter flavescens]|uniref:TRAP transporter large permease protein n=1 Tax=Conservatibacter flavescens TaxID=28161 RepID=A0A2M8S4W4_9PAST|nr:TRAP transporter large permease [Conservatibacter flavescens]PJG86179.1 hypothetical protein CVP05_03140 [Conservatibacter flavescens]